METQELWNSGDRMYCEIYRCHMSVEACIKRQKNAKNTGRYSNPGFHPGALDVNCRDCKQGREIMEKNNKMSDVGCQVSGGDVMAKDPRETRIEDLPGPKSKGELETRICSQADCEFGGDPQPIDNFRRNLRYPEKRFKKCNSCVSKRMQAGQRRRQERLREERKEGKKIRRLEDQGGKDERLSEPEATTSLRPTSNVEYRVSNEKTGPLQACIVIPELPPYGEYVTELPEVRVLEALLDGLPEVFAKIIEIARDQERTPEAQVRYLLKTDYRITGK
jgi:hypothetical protein